MTDETDYVDNTKKKHDLKLAFNKLEVTIDNFIGELIAEDMTRAEVESLIMQVNRVTKKLEKYKGIYRSAYGH